MEDLYRIVIWPNSQELQKFDKWEENCCLINDEIFLDMYGSSSYFVNVH